MAIIDLLKNGNNGSGGGAHAMSEPDAGMRRRTLIVMMLCGILVFLILIAFYYNKMIIKNELYETEALQQQVRTTIISTSRGTIYDSNMKILAMSADTKNVYISPAEIVRFNEDPVEISRFLAETLNVDYGMIISMTEETESWYKVVKRDVDLDTAAIVTAYITKNNLQGIKTEDSQKRHYPYNSLASHVVGYVGFENTGLSGIELALDSVLTGSSGRIIRARDVNNKDLLYTDYEDFAEKTDGYDVVLTIDSNIQYYLEKHLEKAIEDYQVLDGAAAIAMEVKTGKILGMVSLDNFDLNNYEEVSDLVKAKMDATEDEAVKNSIFYNGQQEMWRNKAVQMSYEPGSTFKIITLAMALEEGLYAPDDELNCDGYIEVTGDEEGEGRHCWNLAGHGVQTLTGAMQHSCNCALIQMGIKIGAETFYDYARAFGFMETTGVELPGEASSLWWSEDVFFASYNKTQLAAASFGQTFNVSPLQLIRAVSAACNGGYLMQPYLVSEIRDENGVTVSKTEPTVLRQVISEETSRTVCEILEQVVCDRVEGTGKNAYVAGYKIGGKTGTSTDTVKEQTGVKEYIVSFIGVAPTDNPEICILVLLDNPSRESGIYVSGGNMAAPVVGDMFADILPYIGIEPNYSPEELANIDRAVPNIEGKTAVEAQAILAESGFGTRIIGNGEYITKQFPDAGSVIAARSDILLYLDSEPSEDLEEVPDLTGLTYSIARQRLGFYGLYINTSANSISDSELVLVTGQSIEAGSMVPHGTVVEVTLKDTDMSNYGRY